MESIDNKFEKLNEVHKNLVLEFAGIMNLDDIDSSIFYLEMSNFNLNVQILNKFYKTLISLY